MLFFFQRSGVDGWVDDSRPRGRVAAPPLVVFLFLALWTADGLRLSIPAGEDHARQSRKDLKQQGGPESDDSSRPLGGHDSPARAAKETLIDAEELEEAMAVLRAAQEQDPTDTGGISISTLSYADNNAVGGAFTTVDPWDFGKAAWRACPDSTTGGTEAAPRAIEGTDNPNHDLLGLAWWKTSFAEVRKVWGRYSDSTHNGSWPVLREGPEGACLLPGSRRDPELPVLVSVTSAPEKVCNSEAACNSTVVCHKAVTWNQTNPIVRWMPDLSDENKNPGLQPQKFYVPGLGHQLQYAALWPPAGTCTESAPCGIIVSLHGSGERGIMKGEARATGKRERERFERVYRAGLPSYLALDPDCAARSASLVLAPQLGREAWTHEGVFAKVVPPLVEKLLAEHPGILDRGQISLTGNSEGGTGSVLGALEFPDYFSTAVANSPDDDPKFFQRYSKAALRGEARLAKMQPRPSPRQLRTLVFAIGEFDIMASPSWGPWWDRFPTAFAERLSDFLNTEGGATLLQVQPGGVRTSVQLRVYKHCGHGIWDQVWQQWPAARDALLTRTRRAPRVVLPVHEWILPVLVLAGFASVFVVFHALAGGSSVKAAGAAEARTAASSRTPSAESGATTAAATAASSSSSSSPPQRRALQPQQQSHEPTAPPAAAAALRIASEEPATAAGHRHQRDGSDWVPRSGAAAAPEASAGLGDSGKTKE